MEFLPSILPGCFEVRPRVLRDDRGQFVKVFQQEIWQRAGLKLPSAEEYHSTSRGGVLRGMHFQLPPWDHEKFVYCIAGTVLDVVLDIRVGSPSFGAYTCFELDAAKSNGVFIPCGLAHGFLAMSDSATLIYKCSTVHAPEYDAGILWKSFGLQWPESSPHLSDRDKNFIELRHFRSPFTYKPEEASTCEY